jgi:hypothetical protein
MVVPPTERLSRAEQPGGVLRTRRRVDRRQALEAQHTVRRPPTRRAAEYLEHLAFSPDSTLLAVGAVGGPRLHEVATGRLVGALTLPYWVQHVAFSPDGETVVALNNAGTLRTWRTRDGWELGTASVARADAWFAAVALSPDRGLLGTVDVADGETTGIALWRLPSARRD